MSIYEGDKPAHVVNQVSCIFLHQSSKLKQWARQVQDLQSQLADLRQENSQLKTRGPDRDPMDIDRAAAVHRRYPSSPTSQEKSQRIQPPVMPNFEHVRRNIRMHSHGIFDIPSQGLSSTTTSPGIANVPELPPRADFAHTSRSYLDSIHEAFPILHWPTFQREVDQIYTARSFHGISPDWINLFFAVMACGTLQASISSPGSPKPGKAGTAFFDQAGHAMGQASQGPNLNHVKTALLLSIFATESNRKTEGATWLATAARYAQMLGLHIEAHQSSVLDAEMRRRLWWAIYVRDRISSLGSHIPMLIQEDDFEVTIPSSVDDRYIQSQGFVRTASTHPPFTGFVAIIHVARLYWEVSRLLKSSVIAPQALQRFEDLFHAKLMLLPESYHVGSDAPLEPAALSPIITLQSARFQLYRQNLSPVCRHSERTEALRRCVTVAQDTAKYITRTLRFPPEKADSEMIWRGRVRQFASNTICIHLWRCMLILCLRADYEAALACLHLASALGNVRNVNSACGKNLAFFLDRLTDRVRSGNGAPHQLEHDEEMIAYVSGDLQGSVEHAWVWTGSVTPLNPSSPHASPPHGNPARAVDESMQETQLPLRPMPGSPENGVGEWAGWTRIERMIRHLIDEHRARLAQPSSYYPPPHNPVKRVQLAPNVPASPTSSTPLSPPTQSSTSRISIANII
ncbi:fungal-specific transcription factor domain-containing protein [Dendryphion nanum]|uniref:Fungal-specific transcription factor domain-containing protein n=1 Tax=Dendryphion nanum TaxID=256645 RepID=A0A9P9IR86_9PLEO|nr:fungal-specific transcription factor domain-containing protein [Dendryphion nanum]